MDTSLVSRSLDSDPSLRTERSVVELYRPIRREMAAVETRIDETLRSAHPALDEVLRYGALLGGKRLRPALVLLAGKACGQLTPAHTTIGAVLELVHTATLVHDDVLDAAGVRRHRETINARWSGAISILLGDWLFSEAYRLAATTGSALACGEIGEAARRICDGELRQVLSGGDLRLSEAEYYEIIQGKTAELCRVGARLGGLLAGAPKGLVAALDHYGNQLGIAFQIADDYLDLWGDAGRVGKTLGTDLAQGKTTLPVVRLLGQLAEAERAEALEILSGPPECRWDRLTRFWQQTDAREYTRERASRFAGEAVAALEELPPSDAKATLVGIARFAVERQF